MNRECHAGAGCLSKADRIQSLEKWLRKFKVDGCVDRLGLDGCNRHDVLFALNMIANPWQSDSWHGTAGMSLRQLNALIKQLRALADEIKKLNSSAIIGLPALLGSNASQDFYQLPMILQRCAAKLQGHIISLGPK